jgi:GNAT superfamily N-acetyltransferase
VNHKGHKGHEEGRNDHLPSSLPSSLLPSFVSFVPFVVHALLSSCRSLGAPAVWDDWMPHLRLSLSLAELHQLPRHPAYKYEYINGEAWISPRPRCYHARLDLLAFVAAPDQTEVPQTAPVRAFRDEDWEALVPVFAASFARQQPFGSLEPGPRQDAARQSLEQTKAGGDGPWVRAASFVAEEGGSAVGALLVTLLPGGDPSDPDTYRWTGPAPDDCLARGAGQAHLTWVFVQPNLAGRGVGMALLRSAAEALLGLGYRELLSTFLLGNDSSMLWHWRAGFHLLPYPLSRRRPLVLPARPGG